MKRIKVTAAHFVMAGLDPAIHVFLAEVHEERGCPAQGRA
jgi:hypothetical protein